MKMISKVILMAAAVAALAAPAMAGDKLIVKNDAGTADVFKVNGTTGLVEIGPWTGAPADVTGFVFNAAGDFFAGNTGAGVGRFRLASNASAGFLYWNTYYSSDTNSYLIDKAKPSYAVRIDGLNDRMQFRRAAPTTGPVTFVDLMVIKGTGNVGIGTVTPTSKLHVVGLPTYTSNANAITGGLTAGAFYTDGAGNLKIVY